ncbi:MAG TPA: tetratricopeptide repeat protein [Bacteriovoracaceae bacterium]|nr:tetratricopeptide repeat protein [Bacteriovoracaceae bacterium]
MTKILAILFILSLSTSCIKTAEQVQREKRFDNMSEQMSDSQSLIGDMVSQMKDMQGQLDKMNGRLEVMEHKQKQIDPDAVKELNENVGVIQGQRQADTAQMTQIQNELKDQKAFLEKLMATLSTMDKESNAPPAKAKKKSAKDDVGSALALVKNNEFDQAKSQLLGLLEEDLSPGDQNKVLHGLGRVEFYSKNYDKALVYFSKIYTKFPKASLAPSCLLFIGKSLQKLGKNDEAKEAFAKLTEDYPQAREVSEAKKEL